MNKVSTVINEKYQPVIGIELHVQLNTKTKLFCACANQFGSDANENTCPICLGYPGVLPVLNEEALKKAAKIALAVGADVNKKSIFERKNYYYPDLPKGYQISQLLQPICFGGGLEIFVEEGDTGYSKEVCLERIQIEEDAGKLLHAEDNKGESLVDLNRCSTPLVEIVSKPQMSSAREAVAYFRAFRELLLYLDVSEGNMQSGNMRCDVNVSLMPKNSQQLGTRTEIKNMNTFKGIESAIAYEIARQTAVLDGGEKVQQQTLLFDPIKKITRPMRSKEEAQDYRYFPDPDLPPAVITDEMLVDIKNSIGELPSEKKIRFQAAYGLSPYHAWLMASEKNMATYYEQAVLAAASQLGIGTEDKANAGKLSSLAIKTCNWVGTEVLFMLNTEMLDITQFKVSAENLGELAAMIEGKEISGKIAKQIFPEMMGGKTARSIVKEKNLAVVRDEVLLTKLADDVIAANAKAANDFKSGNAKSFGFLVGAAMKASSGKADPTLMNAILKKRLEN